MGKKDITADRFVDIPDSGVAEIWVIEGEEDFDEPGQN